ncbi:MULTISPECIES: E3 binding domain-containing protein [Silvimonas]|uniref:E3 binding domain-containing protein n=1 Tax=Silvimonas TaxID=300264 RepID=UPI0024B37B3E|nr:MULTISPECIES: E3 binding domain-containing protein [Silvimonas]MDR3429799.1 E3 binding domain-containing protein [Silvimonas sp.]
MMTKEYTTHLICAPEFAGQALVAELHSAVGAGVSADDLLVTLRAGDDEIAIHAPAAGFVDRYLVETGDQIESTGLLLMMEVEDEDGDWLEILPPPVQPGDDEPPALVAAYVARRDYLVASLKAAQLAARLGVDLAEVAGTGAQGEIEEHDVERHVRGLLRR